MQTIVEFNVYPKPLSVVGIEGKSSCNGLNQIKSQTPKLQIQYVQKTRPSKQCKSLIWIIILFSVLICYRICREEQLSQGTLLRGTLLRRTLLWGILRDIDIWWYWVNIGRYWLVFGGAGQYGAVLVGTWWYWVSMTWYCLVLSGIHWVNKGL